MTASSPDLPDRRVSLAPADWGGLLAVCLTVVILAGSAAWKIHNKTQENSERLARIEAQIESLDSSICNIEAELRGQRMSPRRDQQASYQP